MKGRHDREYIKALRRNYLWLGALLHSPDYVNADLHLLVAGRLRILLADENEELVIRYAEQLGIDLQVWGPYPAGSDFGELLFVFNALIASWDRPPAVYDAYQLPIRAYLETPIGIASVRTQDESSKAVPYAPREVIKSACNKEGVTHLNIGKPSGLRYLQETKYHTQDVIIEEAELRRIMSQIGNWTLKAIEHVLESP